MCQFTSNITKITEKFQKVSLKIIEVKDELLRQEHKLAAEALAELQQLEEAKLRLTVDVYVKKRMLSDNESNELSESLAENKQRLSQLTETINDSIEELRYQVFETEEF